MVNAARASVPVARIRAAVLGAVDVPEIGARLPAGESEVAVRISGDRELRALNARHLGEDHATDVLSFPSGELEGAGHLGDIVISWPAVKRQAEEFAHEPEAEMLLLVVHGFLHLLGWDHVSTDEELEMSRLTVDALSRVGVRLAAGRLLDASRRG